MDEWCNSWPNRETWLAARWLFSYRYGELMHASREFWRATSGKARDAKVRRQMAGRMRALVATAGDVVDGLPSWGMRGVCWERLADHFLGGIPGYRSRGSVP